MRFLDQQLRPRRFHSANKVFRLQGGTEDNDLWAELAELDDQVIGECWSSTSLYVPTDEQRQAIMDGANIALTLIHSQPPVMLRLSDEPLGKP